MEPLNLDMDFRNAYFDSTRAVLHVDPVILVVPEHLDALVLLPVQGVWHPRGGLYEKVVSDVPLAHQHQHPAVDAQTMKFVRRRGLFQLMG